MSLDTILVADDDVSVLRVIAAVLEEEGFDVLQSGNGAECMRLFFDKHPDLVLLDILMPVKDGRETCRQIREVSDVPIIMLTALSDEKEKVARFSDGADDYIAKPFNNTELIARIRALLRRARIYRTPSARIYDDGHFQINFDSHEAFISKEPIHFTPKELQVLEYLLKNKNKVVTRPTLLRHIWGKGYESSGNLLKVIVSNVRKKMRERGRHARYIQTEHTIGYRFQTHD